jgi:hypothetical protein
MMTDQVFDPTSLLCCDDFQRLLALKSSVNPFDVYGIASNEVAHSRILGKLLESVGPVALGSALIPRLLAKLRLPSGSPLEMSMIVKLSAAHFKSFAEYHCRLSDTDKGDSLGRMDLLLQDDAQKLAVVIENKIWATEQPKQIERYQKWLKRERPQKEGWHCLVIYLTPTGEAPKTELREEGLPYCACLGYRDLAQALEGIESMDDSGVVHSLLQNIRSHIMEETVEKKLVREIMANPKLAMTLKKIVANMPRISDIQDLIVAGVRKKTEYEIEVKTYPPNRGDVREIMIYIRPWRDAGAGICFNFYQGDEWPTLRTMIHADCWGESKPIMKNLAKEFPEIIHPTCPQREEWKAWRLVFADDFDTRDAWAKTIVKDCSFTNSTAEGLLAKFDERFDKLKPAMDALLANPEKYRGTMP